MKTRTMAYIGVFWLGLVALLVFVPRVFPPDPALPNVAAMLGYNINLAYGLILGWVALGVVFFGLHGIRNSAEAVPDRASDMQAEPPPGPVVRWTERGIIGAGVLVFYWPWSLARFGQYIEDSYFLAALWRMACGGRPYVDFEFLYGPLMIYPVNAWMQLFGFSTASYYLFYALLQTAFFVLLVAILQHFIPQQRTRYLAFLALIPFVFDALLGLNWIAWRYFSVVLIVLLLAARPRELKTALLAGVILGVQSAYSYEYGIAALLAAFAIFVTLLFEPGRKQVLAAGATLAVTTAVVWFGLVALVTGGEVSIYFQATAQIARMANGNGLGQFAFVWTLHSLALFGLLSVATAAGGFALFRFGRRSASKGDLQLIGASVFMLIALKIGMQRADFLHLGVPFVPLIVMLLINCPVRLYAIGSGVRKIVLILIAVASVTQAIAQWPLAYGLAERSARGLKHIVTDRPKIDDFASRRPSVLAERTYPDAAVIAIAERLAEPNIAERPVLFYGELWDRAFNSGICPVGYSFYDILYSDTRVPLDDTVNTSTGLIVVMRDRDYERLFNAAPKDTSPPVLSAFKRFASLTSSIHWKQSPLENGIEYDMWKTSLGDRLVRDFITFDTVADMVLLEQKQ